MSAERRPGGRSAHVRQAVQQATVAELAEHGYQGLTVEAVATRAGVHKTTVYRRWTNAAGLIADIMQTWTPEPWPVPGTGSLADDLRIIARHVYAEIAALGPLAGGVVAAVLENPDALRSVRAYYQNHFHHAAQAVHQAIERGEVPAGTDATEVIRIAIAPIHSRLFVTHEPVTGTDVERAADAAAAAARAGVLTQPSVNR